MRPLSEFAIEARRDVRGVLFDIDDTLTTEGRLTAEAYAAMERLGQAGLFAVPITGRPAGWCDHIARMWPVDGVVGENGALYFCYDRARRTMRRRYIVGAESRASGRERLQSVAQEILQVVPGAAVAADQSYRETDLAIDFCEDVPRLGALAVDQIVSIMQKRGLTVKVSSIHVNGWFGNYDKLTMTKQLMAECHGIDLDAERARFVFIGDSPNDAPMFAYFPHSVGVANVSEFAARIAHPPAYVTQQPCGKGFRELADCILQSKTLISQHDRSTQRYRHETD
jgi:HAD superfamily hydrolase (TIGR01484 family)